MVLALLEYHIKEPLWILLKRGLSSPCLTSLPPWEGLKQSHTALPLVTATLYFHFSLSLITPLGFEFIDLNRILRAGVWVYVTVSPRHLPAQFNAHFEMKRFRS